MIGTKKDRDQFDPFYAKARGRDIPNLVKVFEGRSCGVNDPMGRVNRKLMLPYGMPFPRLLGSMSSHLVTKNLQLWSAITRNNTINTPAPNSCAQLLVSVLRRLVSLYICFSILYVGVTLYLPGHTGHAGRILNRAHLTRFRRIHGCSTDPHFDRYIAKRPQ